MKKIVILVFCCCSISYGQSSGTNDLDITADVASYHFVYNQKFNSGTSCVGLTFTLNASEKFNLQFGFLVDLKKYTFYEKYINTSTGSIGYKPVKRQNFFVPLICHYKYFDSDKVDLLVSGGIMIGGSSTLNNNNSPTEIGRINYMLGSGISFQLTHLWTIRTIPSLRYNSGYFFPGMSLDVSILIK